MKQTTVNYCYGVLRDNIGLKESVQNVWHHFFLFAFEKGIINSRNVQLQNLFTRKLL
jgi:hypothetical protein